MNRIHVSRGVNRLRIELSCLERGTGLQPVFGPAERAIQSYKRQKPPGGLLRAAFTRDFA